MMRLIKKILLYTALIAGVLSIFNFPVTTHQGIDGVVEVKKIPLYAKVCGFLYRDYQYRALADSLTAGIAGDRELSGQWWNLISFPLAGINTI